MIGSFLARAGGAAFCAIGVGGLLAPEALGKNYGVPATTPEAQAYVRSALTATLVVSTIAAVTDGVNASGTPSVALHAGGAVALLAAAAFVAAER